jgi:hypothetical protein
MQAEVVSVDHSLAPRAPQGWWLQVVWRFSNAGEVPLYVLTAGPLLIIDATPIVLNHAIEDDSMGVDPYADLEMDFTAIAANAFADLPRKYPLPAIDLLKRRDVVGRFSVGFERPDPEWRERRMWGAVRQWQRILQSSYFEINVPAE